MIRSTPVGPLRTRLLLAPFAIPAAAGIGALAAASACSLIVDTGGLAGPPLGAADADTRESSLADASAERANVDAESAAARYRASVLSDRPIAYWTFDEPVGSGSRAS